ncbi:U4/U6 small nuclear ribonucleoprotein prp4 [Rhodotorula mucilaginosa]|uniref:non-specific serine/threonine protein kinase n=1 Tax=Rhodotorula mucilaginosa TaxID=5537 RepID=A0A9P7B3X7_RHOMI|nr:U4/U6 small nuclear ribonucleoprotein prp4 [Rhodotorula mucilaginosa]TKA50795.1 hypothetical protein B0A53_06154 [Rhodotorula sp. CCFEE 5036]
MSRRHRNDDDDDGQLPWWEQDRHARGGGRGAYHDRDSLPYDDRPPAPPPPRGQPAYRDRGGGPYRHPPRDHNYDRRYTPSQGHRAAPRDGDRDRLVLPPSHDRVAHPPPRSHPPPRPLARDANQRETAPNQSHDKEEEAGKEEGEVTFSLDPVEEPDPEAILAERRRKRAEILAKYANNPPPPPPARSETATPSASDLLPRVDAFKKREGDEEEGSTPGREQVERAAKRLRIQGTDSPAVVVTAPGTPGLGGSSNPPSTRSTSVDPLQAASASEQKSGTTTFSLEKDAQTSAEEQTAMPREDEADEISAADYDPEKERKRGDDDRQRVRDRERDRAELAAGSSDVAAAAAAAAGTEPKGETVGNGGGDEEDEEEEVIEVEEEEEDDDDDDDDDMFAIGTEDSSKKKEKKKKTRVVKRKKGGNVPLVDRGLAAMTDSTGTAGAAPHLADNYDDPEGYYKVILGEALDQNRYHVVAHLGKGMFANVVRARDWGEKGLGKYEGEKEGLGGKGVGEGEKREVAIKIVRSQESMYKAGLKEAQILRKLRDADPDDKKHVVRLLRTFEHRGHLCLVFESLSMNLREVVKRYGKDIGLNLRAVRAYASQMFLALALMRKCEIMHADLKPDNILVNESKSVLKVSDLGSASDVTENEITPYLVSRFYRAPEIILGLPYDCSLDVWSIACTLYELYTGKILFPGRTNNHMLLLIMETKGKFNHKLIRKARFHDQHFDEQMNFLYTEKNDTVTPRAIPAKPSSDMRSRLMPSGVLRRLKEDEARLLTNFVDLLEKMLSLEPAKRPTPKELLSHPFIRG